MKQNVSAQVISGNPISFYAYIHNFFTKWYHLVDKLYVQIDMTSESIIRFHPYVKDLYYDICKNDPKIVIKEVYNVAEDLNNGDVSLSNGFTGGFTGSSIRYVVNNCDTDIIFCTHDDLYITDVSILENHLNLVKTKQKDFVTVTSSALSEKYIKLCLEKYPFLKEKIKEYFNGNFQQHVGINTSYFIVNKLDLLQTRMNFEGQSYSIGTSPYGIDHITTEEDGFLYMEHGIDVVFQMYKNGKTNPLLFCTDETTWIYDIKAFKTDNDFSDLIKNKHKYGHVHFSSSSIVKRLFSGNFETHVNSHFNPNIKYHTYPIIIYYERVLTEYIGLAKLIDTNLYPNFSRFVDDFTHQINLLVAELNKALLKCEYDQTDYEEHFKHILLKQTTPYQLDINILPTYRIKDFIGHNL